jgi:hypothetical protein
MAQPSWAPALAKLWLKLAKAGILMVSSPRLKLYPLLSQQVARLLLESLREADGSCLWIAPPRP